MSHDFPTGLIDPSPLFGSYRLLKFEIESPSGTIAPWAKDVHGTLIYSQTGHMSVAINSKFESEAPLNAKNLLDSILFYSGTFVLKDGEVVHSITEASDPSRIGKTLRRNYHYENEVLTLTSPIETFGKAILKWKRI